MCRFARNCAVWLIGIWGCAGSRSRSSDQVLHWGPADCSGSQPAQQFRCGAEVGLASAGCLSSGAVGRRAKYWPSAAGALWHNARSGHGLLALTGYLAVTVWGSVTGWPLAVMILSLAYLWEAGVMLMWSTLRSRADLDHVAMGTACLLVGSASLLLGIANPPDAWTLSMVAGLLR